ncbi:MAG: hypothetical protein Q8911_06690 [Bacillota bacterium]|nr:hypothetical protein [Bacillota bacterium]
MQNKRSPLERKTQLVILNLIDMLLLNTIFMVTSEWKAVQPVFYGVRL